MRRLRIDLRIAGFAPKMQAPPPPPPKPKAAVAPDYSRLSNFRRKTDRPKGIAGTNRTTSTAGTDEPQTLGGLSRALKALTGN